MGKENIELIGKEKSGTGGRGTASSTDTASTGNNGGRGTGRGRGKGTGTGDNEKSLVVPDVKGPKIVSVEVPGKEVAASGDEKPKRGRPSGSTAKKKKTPVKPKGVAMDHTQLSLLLVTMTGILASRENMGPFALTMVEANQISLPLANILSKNEGLASATAEYADHIALLFAAATIIIPKFMIYKSERNERELTEYAMYQHETREIAGNSESVGRDSRNSDHVQNDSSTFSGTIGDFLSPIA